MSITVLVKYPCVENKIHKFIFCFKQKVLQITCKHNGYLSANVLASLDSDCEVLLIECFTTKKDCQNILEFRRQAGIKIEILVELNVIPRVGYYKNM